MSDMLLSVDGISFQYDNSQWTLSGVSLNLKAGDFLGIIGPNGSGKSTLLKIAAGLIQPAEGSVCVCGQNVKAVARRKIAAQIGYLPQYIISTFDYRVEDVISMGRFVHLKGMGFLDRSDIEAVQRVSALTETTDYRDRKLSQLSGGERQRVMLASVLAQEPKVLLLDEPTTGLDIHHQASFFRLLTSLAKQGLAIAVVTHELNLASLFCKQLLLLKDGKAHTCGSPEQTLTPEILGNVYPGSLFVGKHPNCGKPIILPSELRGQEI